MSLLKVISLFLITTASFQISAQSMSGFLDLGKLARGTNAGRYFVGVGLNPLASAELQVTQELAEPPSDASGSETKVCYTEFRLVAGSLGFILTDADNDTKLSLNREMILMTAFWDESAECTPVAELLKNKLVFSSFFNLGGIGLDYKAPRGFERIFLAMSVMPYGNSLELAANYFNGKAVISNLKEQLTAQIKRGNNEGLYYYAWAEDERSLSEELGRGYIELK